MGTLLVVWIIGMSILALGATLEWVGRRRGWEE